MLAWGFELRPSRPKIKFFPKAPFEPPHSDGPQDAARGRSVKILKSIETKRDKYFADWKDRQATTANLNDALASTTSLSSLISQKIGKIRTEKINAEESIKTYDDERNKLKDTLGDTLKQFGDEVQK